VLTFPALSIFLLLTAMLCLVLAGAALSQGRSAFSRYYAGLMCAAVLYAAGYGLELVSPDRAGMWAMLRIQYLGIPFIPFCWIGLAYAYLEPAGLPRRGQLSLLALAAVMLIAPESNDWHHLYYTYLDYSRVDGVAIAHSGKGPLYWLNIVYLNVGAAYGVLLLFRAWRQSISLYRSQAALLLGGSLLPWLFHLLYQAGLAPRGIDIAPFGIAATGVTFAVATMRHRVLEFLPIARDLVFDSIAEGVIVFDNRGRIVDFNRAATRLMPGLDLSLIGRDGAGVVAMPGTAGAMLIEQGARQLEIRRDMLNDRRGRAVGAVLLIRDVSEKMAMIEELRQFATQDSLTGCHNRRHLFELCRHEVLVAQRYERQLALIMLDIDDFKAINDSQGHPVGDRMLLQVSVLLRDNLRDSDILGRYGGDEFIIILPETDGASAARIAAQLCRLAMSEIGVSLSLGVAECTSADDVDALLLRADMALYRAKQRGKNQAVFDSLPPGDAGPGRNQTR
jgi:diguanylate cyclase (GGDEF)-like protein